MLRVRLVALAAALAVGSASLGASAETITLNTALGLAYETNPTLDAQRAALRATDEGVAQARAGYLPVIQAQGQYGWQRYSSDLPLQANGSNSLNEHPLIGQVTVTEPLFRGGKTVAEVGRAKALVRQGRAQLIDGEQQLLLSGVAAYMNVVRDTASVKLQENNVGLLKRQLDATTEQFNVGELTKTDVSQSQARLAGAQAQLTLARGQLASDRAIFEQVIGRAPEALEETPPLPALPADEDTAIAVSAKQNPGVVAAREAERAADLAIDDAVGNLSPQLSVQGQYQYDKGSVSNGLGPSALRGVAVLGQVTWNIYDGGADEASIRQAKELHSQAQMQIAVADRQAREQAQAAWNTYESAKAAVVSNQVQATADQTAYQGVKQEEQVGGRTILDVLNAQQELLNAQVAVVTAQRDAYVAAYQLLAATGQLTAKALGLHVKFYNPKDHYKDDQSRWLGFGD
jgi:outer membrane protein